MTDPTPATGLPFSLPSGQEIYDALMGEIEPELVTANLPLLTEKYKDETAEQKQIRYKRYDLAYKKYDEAFKKWSEDFQAAVSAVRRSALTSAEARSKDDDGAALSRIESSFA